MAAWTSRKPLHPESIDNGVDNARAAIVFCGFSIIPWVKIRFYFFLIFRTLSNIPIHYALCCSLNQIERYAFRRNS